MMDTELLPIGPLDRRSTIERRLDNLLIRYSKLGFRTYNAAAAYADLLEAYFSVVRRRYEIPRGKRTHLGAVIEGHYLELITQDAQDEITRRTRLAKQHLLSGGITKEIAKAIEVLENLERDLPRLSDSSQRKIAATNRELSPMQQILTRLVKRNHHITEPQVIESLRDMKGDGIVLEIDEEYVEINVTPPGSKGLKVKPYKLSGIGAGLSRIKKTLNITRV